MGMFLNKAEMDGYVDEWCKKCDHYSSNGAIADCAVLAAHKACQTNDVNRVPSVLAFFIKRKGGTNGRCTMFRSNAGEDITTEEADEVKGAALRAMAESQARDSIRPLHAFRGDTPFKGCPPDFAKARDRVDRVEAEAGKAAPIHISEFGDVPAGMPLPSVPDVGQVEFGTGMGPNVIPADMMPPEEDQQDVAERAAEAAVTDTGDGETYTPTGPPGVDYDEDGEISGPPGVAGDEKVCPGSGCRTPSRDGSLCNVCETEAGGEPGNEQYERTGR